ncbi:MAG TPA: TPM domain-containing protein, partial [Vicinamibacteria bacterium]|nr:TPM domain-containing protein [Vicinamibacteria bacterium]
MTDSFFSKIDEPRIVEAIRAAELGSRGEIRIHATEKAVTDVLREATGTFERLGMTATAERNGILIFVAPKNQKFAATPPLTRWRPRCRPPFAKAASPTAWWARSNGRASFSP